MPLNMPCAPTCCHDTAVLVFSADVLHGLRSAVMPPCAALNQARAFDAMLVMILLRWSLQAYGNAPNWDTVYSLTWVELAQVG